MAPDDPRKSTPRSIAQTRDGAHVRVEWADGHESLLPLLVLRRACPCATCNEEKETRATQLAPSPAKPAAQSALRFVSGPSVSELALSRLSGVGRYAVQLYWADGHDTGIFPFELLRSLCPCDECRAERGESATPK